MDLYSSFTGPILLGIVLALLNAFSASYFQKVLDDFGDKNLSIVKISIYAVVLILVCGLNYFDEYLRLAKSLVPVGLRNS
jgi:predicted PurR-regulated permease PerM